MLSVSDLAKYWIELRLRKEYFAERKVGISCVECRKRTAARSKMKNRPINRRRIDLSAYITASGLLVLSTAVSEQSVDCT